MAHESKLGEVSTSSNIPDVSVTIVGCGGCGVNLARTFKQSRVANTLYFDTSLANSRYGEQVYVIGNGSGSGGNRRENAKLIERELPQISDTDIGKADVAVVIFSLGGGSGSVLAPLLIREYAKRGQRTIGVCIADTSYGVSADNNLNTLKTLTSVAGNNNIYLPIILISNDYVATRKDVNETAITLIQAVINILTTDVLEVDRNDRLNWVDPSKVTKSAPGLKIMSFTSDEFEINPKIALGVDSEDMVDSMLVLTGGHDDPLHVKRLHPTRLKKVGIYIDPHPQLIGRVSSDITSIEEIIDRVEHMQHASKSQKHESVDRLSSNNSDDLHL